MSMFDKLSRLFGLHPALGLHDLDLPDEPVLWPPSLKDRPAAQSGEASAAGHPNSHVVDWGVIREGMAELRTVLVDALAWLDEIDPVAAELAQAASVTDINTKRR